MNLNYELDFSLLEEKRKLIFINNEINRIVKLKDMVRLVLRNMPITRSDDRLLTIIVWKLFYNIWDVLHIEEVLHLPSQASIQRIRAYFQNTLGEFLPSDDVYKSRKLRSWVMKTEMKN